MTESKCEKLEDINEWKRWFDPSGLFSRKLFDQKLKAAL